MDRHVVNTAELQEYESLGWLIHVLSNLGDGNIYSGARILYNKYVRLHNRVRSRVPPVVDIDRGLAPHSPEVILNFGRTVLSPSTFADCWEHELILWE